MRPFTIDEVIALAPCYFDARTDDDARVLGSHLDKIVTDHGMWHGMYMYLESLGFEREPHPIKNVHQQCLESVLADINTKARRHYINKFLLKKLSEMEDHEMMEVIMRLGYNPEDEPKRMLEINTYVTQEDVQKEFDRLYSVLDKEVQDYCEEFHVAYEPPKLVFRQM